MYLNDSLKQKNIITVNDGIIAHSEREWANFFGYTPKNLPCCSFYKEKNVNFWFPHCDSGGHWLNVLSPDGLTLTETSSHIVPIDKYPNKHYPPRLLFPRYIENGKYCFKFVGVFLFSDEESKDGVMHIYKRISDHLSWNDGNPHNFYW